MIAAARAIDMSKKGIVQTNIIEKRRLEELFDAKITESANYGYFEAKFSLMECYRQDNIIHVMEAFRDYGYKVEQDTDLRHYITINWEVITC